MKKALAISRLPPLLPLLLPAFAQAHPGHDHSHWLSEPIHVLTILAIAAVSFVAVGIGRSVKKKVKQEK